ncbi:hypothetical protein BV22DRAFT_933921 [Leucogyrophana mollusca]|uniref:Uncharacterized protein n=1 Tax=Leucogyrophana mollusca TaxID=85980 RepID=A0ACB8AVM7_9AGAM|nr:hypothetical protein BV22DRAFT_933921 [Leucogyrophana mollusca]
MRKVHQQWSTDSGCGVVGVLVLGCGSWQVTSQRRPRRAGRSDHTRCGDCGECAGHDPAVPECQVQMPMLTKYSCLHHSSQSTSDSRHNQCNDGIACRNTNSDLSRSRPFRASALRTRLYSSPLSNTEVRHSQEPHS